MSVWRCAWQILQQIEQYGISLYPLPDCDDDEEEDYKEQCRQLKVLLHSIDQGSHSCKYVACITRSLS